MIEFSNIFLKCAQNNYEFNTINGRWDNDRDISPFQGLASINDFPSMHSCNNLYYTNSESTLSVIVDSNPICGVRVYYQDESVIPFIINC